jgi:hypothetical protein
MESINWKELSLAATIFIVVVVFVGFVLRSLSLENRDLLLLIDSTNQQIQQE